MFMRFIVLLGSFLFFIPLFATAAPIQLFAPWNEGDRWIAGVGCYSGGSYYGEDAHQGNDYYAVDFNGVFNANCQQTANDDGKEIRATNAGTVSVIEQDPNASGYGYYVLLNHGNGVTSRYAHLKYNPTQQPGIQVGQQISRGQIIGYTGSTGGYFSPHLHFVLYQNGSSVRPDPMDGQSLCDACEGALILSSNSTSTSATSWNFTTTNEGWEAINATDQGIYASNYWKFDPGVDAQLISPQLSAVNASTYKILKIRMDVPGTGSDTGKVYFKNNISDSWSESKSVSFAIDKSASGQQTYYAQMRDNQYWTGSIPQIRIDPVVNYPSDNTGSIYLDSVTFESATDANSFLGQGATPSATVTAGQPFSIWFQVQNTGNTKWDSTYSLKLDSSVNPNYPMGAANPTYVFGTVLPGGSYTFNLNMTAPTAAGTYHTEWKVANTSGTLFGVRLFLDITVAAPSTSNRKNNWNADGKTDIGVFMASAGRWYVRLSNGSQFYNASGPYTGGAWLDSWCDGTALPISGDYNGDGRTDIACDQPNGNWFVALNQGDRFVVSGGAWMTGFEDAKDLTGDFNGDGKTDILSYSNSGLWFVRLSNGSTFYNQPGPFTNGAWMEGFGGTTSIPFTGDFTGDGLTDIAVWDGSTGYWYVRASNGSQFYNVSGPYPGGAWVTGFGSSTQYIADLNGDGKADILDYGGGNWYARFSTGSSFVNTGGTPYGSAWITGFSNSSDTRLTGDINGDGLGDIISYDPTTGLWFTRLSNGSYFYNQPGPYTNGAWMEGFGGTDQPAIKEGQVP